MSIATLGNRTLDSFTTPRGELKTMTLESVRDRLAKRAELQNPRTIERSMSQMHIGIDPETGKATARFLDAHTGLGADVFGFTRNGLQMAAREVLPTRGLNFLEELAAKGEHGRKLATVNWATFAHDHDKPRTLRVIDANGSGPVIRSVVSQSYTAFDNLQAVQAILDSGFAGLPVLAHHETDTGFRLRLALEDANRIETGKPIRMLEVWNSEVGRRSFGLCSGIFKLVCTNGMHSWEKETSYRWVHSGDPNRIVDGVSSAIKEIDVKTKGVVEAYERATNVAIDDAYAWMEAQLRGDLTQEQLVRASKALTDDTTTPGGVLASCVDAITLAAQDETDLYAQAEMERSAGKLLRRGLAISLRTEGNLVAPVTA